MSAGSEPRATGSKPTLVASEVSTATTLFGSPFRCPLASPRWEKAEAKPVQASTSMRSSGRSTFEGGFQVGPLAQATHDQVHRPRREPPALTPYEQRRAAHPVEPRPPLRDPPVQRLPGFGVERHLPVGVALAASHVTLPLRGDREIVLVEAGKLLQAQGGVEEERCDRPVAPRTTASPPSSTASAPRAIARGARRPAAPPAPRPAVPYRDSGRGCPPPPATGSPTMASPSSPS